MDPSADYLIQLRVGVSKNTIIVRLKPNDNGCFTNVVLHFWFADRTHQMSLRALINLFWRSHDLHTKRTLWSKVLLRFKLLDTISLDKPEHFAILDSVLLSEDNFKYICFG